jgi:DNA-binding response OmpR family regulator
MNEPNQSASILLIDDDRELSAILSHFLSAGRLKISVSRSGEQDLIEFASNQFARGARGPISLFNF